MVGIDGDGAAIAEEPVSAPMLEFLLLAGGCDNEPTSAVCMVSVEDFCSDCDGHDKRGAFR